MSNIISDEGEQWREVTVSGEQETETGKTCFGLPLDDGKEHLWSSMKKQKQVDTICNLFQ